MREPILVINAGSSCIKFSVFETAADRSLPANTHDDRSRLGGMTIRKLCFFNSFVSGPTARRDLMRFLYDRRRIALENIFGREHIGCMSQAISRRQQAIRKPANERMRRTEGPQAYSTPKRASVRASENEREQVMSWLPFRSSPATELLTR